MLNKKEVKMKILMIIKKNAERELVKSANSTTCFRIYQPKAPKDLKRFKRVQK